MSERFKNANTDNILLYILEGYDDHSKGTEIIQHNKLEIDGIIIGRNKLAKAIKNNQQVVKMPKSANNQRDLSGMGRTENRNQTYSQSP